MGLQVLLIDVSDLTWFQCMKYFVITILTAKICILQCYYNMFVCLSYKIIINQVLNISKVLELSWI